MLQISVKNRAGEVVETLDVADDVFGVAMNRGLVHQALVRQLANARRGSANTKTRGEVAGGGRKPWRQKGTGRARQGSIRSPQWRHGGVVFGPHARSYKKRMPKKMRSLALRCLLSDKFNQQTLVVVQDLAIDGVKTKDIINVLGALEVGRTSLLVTAGTETNVSLSARNVPGVKTLPAALLNVGDLLKYESLVMTTDALRLAEQMWGAGNLSREDGQVEVKA